MSANSRQHKPVAILAHGAGSTADFLAGAFPADRLGVASCEYLDDRTAQVSSISQAISESAEAINGPVLLGGVSLGAHAAASLLADPPDNVVGAILCLPAWTGPAAEVASLTSVAAEAIAVLGIQGVLDELPPQDWVTQQLRRAWNLRTDAQLTTELFAASTQPGPTVAQLRSIKVPVGLVQMAGDPLHPASVAAQWATEIPHSAAGSLSRDDPASDLAVFADVARQALRDAFHT